MMPFSSVAIIEKLALLRIALCKAPVLSRASLRCTSMPAAFAPAALAQAVESSSVADMAQPPFKSRNEPPARSAVFVAIRVLRGRRFGNGDGNDNPHASAQREHHQCCCDQFQMSHDYFPPLVSADRTGYGVEFNVRNMPSIFAMRG